MPALSPARRVGVYLLIVVVQVISAGYTVLTRDAIRMGNADALVFSLYRDAIAFPLLILWAFLAEHLPSCRKERASSSVGGGGSKGGHRGCCEGGGGGGRDAADSTWSKGTHRVDEDALQDAQAFKHHGICPRCRDLPRFFGLGLFGMFGNQFCYIMSLEYISSDAAAILNLSQIVFVAVLAASPIARFLGARQEKLTWPIIVGIVLALGGAVVMFEPWQVYVPSNTTGGSGGNFTTAGDDLNSTTAPGRPASMEWAGYLFVLGSCISMSLYYLLQKKSLRDYGPITVTAYSYAFGAAIMGVVSLYNVVIKNYIAFLLSTQALEALAFAVLANSVVKYGVSSIANKFVSATLLVAAGTLAPIFVVVFSYFDPEQHAAPQLSYLGGIAIVGGIVLVTWGRNRTVRKSAGSISLLLDEDDGGGAENSYWREDPLLEHRGDPDGGQLREVAS